MRLPGVVEFAFAVVAFGRGEGDDLAGVGVDRGEAGGRAAFGVTDAAGVDRFLRAFLQLGVDRRVGLEPAVAHGVDPVFVDQLLLDQVEEEGVVDHPVLVARAEAEAAVQRASRYSAPVDVALLVHRVEHLVAALQRRVRVEEGVVFGRRLRQAGDQRRFGQAEVLGRLAEVGLRRRLDADRGLALRPCRRGRC